jgi:hypothetical protein
MKEYVCKDCGIEGASHFYAKGYRYQCKKCWNKRTYKVARDKLDQLIIERGGKCERCKYDKSFAALQWHHIDPSIKEFGISGKRGAPIEQLRKEINKCTLLCANCHAEVHAGLVWL